MAPDRSLEREIERYVAGSARSSELNKEASNYLPGGDSRTTVYFDPYPSYILRGQGCRIYDADGHERIDFMINATSLILGHAHPAIVKALQDQTALGTAFGGPTETQIRLARMLCERIPSMELMRFVNSGTEATLNAIGAARAYTGKYKIAKFEGAYHGTHNYVAVSVRPPLEKLDPDGWNPVSESPGVPPHVLEEVVVLPYNDLEGTERLVRRHKDELAAVLVEPVMSNLGYVPGSRQFLEGVRRLTQELGILLIFDEVQSFRLSPGGAQALFGVTPDITALGKVIGGGLPVGAFGGRRDIMALYDPSQGRPQMPHPGTFNANPMTMTAGAVVMEQLTPEVYGRLAYLGDMLREQLRAVFAELEVPTQVTGIGSLFGIHFTSEKVSDYRSAARGDQAMKRRLFLGLLNEGIMLASGCTGALCTPMGEPEIEALVDATRRVVQRVRE